MGVPLSSPPTFSPPRIGNVSKSSVAGIFISVSIPGAVPGISVVRSVREVGGGRYRAQGGLLG